jgi:hypothetical protein
LVDKVHDLAEIPVVPYGDDHWDIETVANNIQDAERKLDEVVYMDQVGTGFFKNLYHQLL